MIQLARPDGQATDDDGEAVALQLTLGDAVTRMNPYIHRFRGWDSADAEAVMLRGACAQLFPMRPWSQEALLDLAGWLRLHGIEAMRMPLAEVVEVVREKMGITIKLQTAGDLAGDR